VNEQLRVQALQNMVQALNVLQQILATNLANVISVRVGTFSSLPASPIEGMLAGISDSTTNTWGATITGGGSFHVLGHYDGNSWTVVGK
jgi:hypothetical protein